MLSDGKWGLCDLMMVNKTNAKASRVAYGGG